MATITVKSVEAKDKESAIAAYAAKEFKTLPGGLDVPVGTHKFQVAEKNAFGFLEVIGASDGSNWALPIVAGTLTYKEAGKDKTANFNLLTGKDGRNLVVSNGAFNAMGINGTYAITIADSPKGKRVTSVVAYEAQAESKAKAESKTKAKK